MQIKFLGQGYEPKSENSVGNLLLNFFANKEFHTFIGISAFASQSGVKGLSKHIETAKKTLKNIKIVLGVDMNGTSKEALESLLDLKVDSYIFYQPSSIIFHPKIYLFEGKERSELIIGSSNLTSRGLFTNIEASLLVSIDNNVDDDLHIIEQLKEYFSGIFRHKDPNLKKLTKKLINDLVVLNLVQTEADKKSVQEVAEKKEKEKIENDISQIFPKRSNAKIPIGFIVTKRDSNSPKLLKVDPGVRKSSKGQLVWTRRKLPASSVQISRSGTNPTGGLRLVQDKFLLDGKRINQTTYFRNNLFGKYTWNKVKSKPFVEAAIVPFEVTINEEFIGIFDLEVRHKPSGEAGQHNYTTSISWGMLSEVIQKTNLTGLKLDLYLPKRKGKPFQIIIS
ncbi:MAG: phospholipase D family protein [Bacteroidales bacterium]|nr:phospholipase D family protein [Bacteroidales bacterium]MCF8455652.1 phospholipase D family protein [Bacteroidales bacterium]